MTAAMRCLVIALACLLLASPLHGQDQRYQGRTVAEWAARLRDPNFQIRKEALQVFSTMRLVGHRGVPGGPAGQAGAKEALPALIWVMEKDPDGNVREMAAWIFASWTATPASPPASTWVDVLVKAMADPDPGMRRAVTRAVSLLVEAGTIGAGEAQVVPGLVQALHDPDIDRRREATAALGRLGPAAKAAVPELQRLVTSDPDLRHQAEVALRSIERR
jgi:HEAT repeat protein